MPPNPLVSFHRVSVQHVLSCVLSCHGFWAAVCSRPPACPETHAAHIHLTYRKRVALLGLWPYTDHRAVDGCDHRMRGYQYDCSYPVKSGSHTHLLRRKIKIHVVHDDLKCWKRTMLNRRFAENRHCLVDGTGYASSLESSHGIIMLGKYVRGGKDG